MNSYSTFLLLKADDHGEGMNLQTIILFLILIFKWKMGHLAIHWRVLYVHITYKKFLEEDMEEDESFIKEILFMENFQV